ncbi:hypothetical protein SK128_013677, partial [Halocaridina rubra]
MASQPRLRFKNSGSAIIISPSAILSSARLKYRLVSPIILFTSDFVSSNIPLSRIIK